MLITNLGYKEGILVSDPTYCGVQLNRPTDTSSAVRIIFFRIQLIAGFNCIGRQIQAALSESLCRLLVLLPVLKDTVKPR